MKFRDIIRPLVPIQYLEKYRVLRAKRGVRKISSIERFEYTGSDSIKEDIFKKYGYSGDFLELFTKDDEQLVHKWHHYIPLYDRYLSPYRNKKKIKFLEIGVSKGGSLNLWRSFFGDDAVIFGIDINPECMKYNGIAGQVRIGSQDDETFLNSVIKEMGGVDIILDDGSHQMKHIEKTLKILFPKLSPNGLYMVEDLHCAYWKDFGGGYQSRNNFFNFLFKLTDDMHHWYHREGLNIPTISKICDGIHIHDSMIVLNKNETHAPVHSKICGSNK